MELVSIMYMEESSHDWTACGLIVAVAALRRCHNMFALLVTVWVQFQNVLVLTLDAISSSVTEDRAGVPNLSVVIDSSRSQIIS